MSDEYSSSGSSKNPEGEGHGMSIPMAERLGAELLRAHIHVGYTAERTKLAERLEHEGLLPAQLSDMWEHMQRVAGEDPYKAAAMLMSRLRSPGLWKALRRELEQCRAGGGGKRQRLENAPQRPYEASVDKAEYVRSRWKDMNNKFPADRIRILCEEAGVTEAELEELLG